jgi:hypothetical protein
VQQRTATARDHLAAVETQLREALTDVEVRDRADKSLITERLRAALDALAQARTDLDAVLATAADPSR